MKKYVIKKILFGLILVVGLFGLGCFLLQNQTVLTLSPGITHAQTKAPTADSQIQAIIDSANAEKNGILLKLGEPFVLVQPIIDGFVTTDGTGRVVIPFYPRKQAYPNGTLDCGSVTYKDAKEVSRKTYRVTNGSQTAQPFNYDATPTAGDPKTYSYSFKTFCNSAGKVNWSVPSSVVTVAADKTVVLPTTGVLPNDPIIDPNAPKANTTKSQPLVAQTDLGPVTDIGSFMTKVFNWAIPITAGVAVLMLIWVGYLYMTSQGNTENITQAKEIILGVVLGVILLFTAEIILKNVIGTLGNSSTPVTAPQASPPGSTIPASPTPPGSSSGAGGGGASGAGGVGGAGGGF